jgi:hypothetical protein
MLITNQPRPAWIVKRKDPRNFVDFNGWSVLVSLFSTRERICLHEEERSSLYRNGLWSFRLSCSLPAFSVGKVNEYATSLDSRIEFGWASPRGTSSNLETTVWRIDQIISHQDSTLSEEEHKSHETYRDSKFWRISPTRSSKNTVSTLENYKHPTAWIDGRGYRPSFK